MQFLPESLETGDARVRTLNHALHYADIEWPVVPLYTMYLKQGICTCHLGADCTSPAKHPVPVNGVKAATVKTEVIRQWWDKHPRANIGIATGHGLFVIDIDPRSGGSLEELQKRFALPDTAMVRTGGNGWHLYYFYSGSLGNSAGKLAEGIDTRGFGGYVVAPPSLHASGSYYTWLNRTSPVPLPTTIIDALTHPIKKVFAVPTPVSPPLTSPLLDVPISDATQLIQLAKATPIPEGKRNSSMLSMAGALRQQGATVDAIFAALKVINLIQCEPPLTESEVKRIAAAAERWELGQPTQAQGTVVPQMYTLDVLLNTKLPDPQWAIPTFLPEGVTLLAGKPKMGKSWFALALALAIAENRLALGKLGVTQGDVLYLGLEDSMRRIADRAAKLLQGRVPPDNFTWVGAWNLLSAGGLADIEDWLYNHKEARLVVIDTLAKVRPPGTNNGNMYNEDYAVMTPLKAIAEGNNVAILVIHHLRKSGAPDVMDTISGTTGLTGATDCNMVLDRERGQNEATLFITGRDVEEQELALTFNPENAQWTLQGGESQRTMSKVRREIIKVLEEADEPLAPKDIAKELDKNSAYIRKVLYDMLKAQEVHQAKRGLYEPARKYDL